MVYLLLPLLVVWTGVASQVAAGTGPLASCRRMGSSTVQGSVGSTLFTTRSGPVHCSIAMV